MVSLCALWDLSSPAKMEPGMEPGLSTVEAQNLDRWAIKEVAGWTTFCVSIQPLVDT